MHSIHVSSYYFLQIREGYGGKLRKLSIIDESGMMRITIFSEALDSYDEHVEFSSAIVVSTAGKSNEEVMIYNDSAYLDF